MMATKACHIGCSENCFGDGLGDGRCRPRRSGTLDAQKVIDHAASNILSKEETYLARGFLSYKKDRDVEKAISLASKALEIAPQSPDVLLVLGNFYYEAGQLTNALINYRLSLVYGSSSSRVFKDIASVFLDSCNYAMSSHFLKRSGADSEDMDIHHLETVIDAAISAVLQKDIANLNRFLSKSAWLINRGALKNAQIEMENRKYAAGYHKFLSALVSESFTGDAHTAQHFIHIGDSHCLTYALGSHTIKNIKTNINE